MTLTPALSAEPIAAWTELAGDRAFDGPCDVGAIERLPKWLSLIPMVIQWLWLSARYRSLTLPSAANPDIACGGLAGEGKLEYFAGMGEAALAATAPFTFIDNTGPVALGMAMSALQNAGLDFPIIAKPNIGWCGFGVRLVRNIDELARYIAGFPLGERIVLQQYIPFEGEAGVYYLRQPGALKGKVVGLLLRRFPLVTGNGVHTIAELIAADPRLRRLVRGRFSEASCDVNTTPAQGARVRVATIGSTRVGGLYRDASALIAQSMTDAFDTIAKDMPNFHVGRFDVRYENLAALCAGAGFKIIEVNGAGSEAVHAWDPDHSLRSSYEIIFKKQRDIFAIGDAMRRRGFKPVTPWTLVRHYLRQQRLIQLYPPSN